MSSATPQAAALQWRDSAVLVRRAFAWLDGTRPLYVLSVFIAAEWLITLAVALDVRHNGWLYYQGGDQLWHYVTAWDIGHGRLPHTDRKSVV